MHHFGMYNHLVPLTYLCFFFLTYPFSNIPFQRTLWPGALSLISCPNDFVVILNLLHWQWLLMTGYCRITEMFLFFVCEMSYVLETKTITKILFLTVPFWWHTSVFFVVWSNQWSIKFSDLSLNSKLQISMTPHLDRWAGKKPIIYYAII